MELSAVILARVIGYIEILDLNPRGTVFMPDLVREIVERYNFQKFPKVLEDFDVKKGVEFLDGQIGNKPIQKLAIWNTLLVLETRSNTDESKKILEEMLAWAADKFGLDYFPGKIKRFAYISDVTFYSNAPILGNVSPAVSKIAAETGKALTEIWGESIHYEPMNLVVGHDQTSRKFNIAPFSIARRAETNFSEGKYFSEAPLPTDMHIAMLEQFERDIILTGTASPV